MTTSDQQALGAPRRGAGRLARATLGGAPAFLDSMLAADGGWLLTADRG